MAKTTEFEEQNLNDVSPRTGYTMEKRSGDRVGNGYGGTQTKLPPGHLARRDAPVTVKKSGAPRR